MSNFAIKLIVACALLYTPDMPRSVLEARYLGSPGDMIEVADTLLHVRDTGPRDGQAVILLHGVGSHLQTWDGWAGALERDYRTVRFDLPGAGLSPPDMTGDYTDTRVIAIMTALMDELDIETASFIGNSLGGRIVWTYAASNPDRVEKLVLVSPDGFASPGFEYGKPPRVPRFLKSMLYIFPKWIAETGLEAAYGDTEALSAQTLERYYDFMLAPGAREALIMRMEQTVLTPPEPMLSQIYVPVLLIWGEADAIIPFSNAHDYQALLKNSTIVPLPGIGHVPQEEDPGGTIGAILTFLSKD